MSKMKSERGDADGGEGRRGKWMRKRFKEGEEEDPDEKYVGG